MSLIRSGASAPEPQLKAYLVEAFSGVQFVQYNGNPTTWRVFKEKFETAAYLSGVLDYFQKPREEISDWSEDGDKVARRAIIIAFADELFQPITASLITTPVNELYTALCQSCGFHTPQRIKESERQSTSQ